jgi:hypothetical protein
LETPLSHAVLVSPLPRARARSGSGIDVLRAIMRGVLIGLGVVLVVLGFLMAPLPGPMGVPVTVGGLILILRNSIWAKRRFVEMQRRHPKVVFPLRRLMRPKPEIFPVAWQSLLRTERLLLAAERRFLKNLRKRMFKRA